ncbi:hypothetical protein [Secundilactobacillus oryzae]|nr:hypothetical protein [Secundilactobacillus oryzae]
MRRLTFKIRRSSKQTRLNRNRQKIAAQLDNQSRNGDQRLAQLTQMHTDMMQMENRVFDRVIAYLNEIHNHTNTAEVDIVRHTYNQHHSRYLANQADQDHEQELFLKAFQFEYNFVQNEVQSGNISKELGNDLYQQISTDELAYMQSSSN